MLRLVIAAVLVCACLAFPQRREGAPADNLKSFDPGMMQGMGGAMPNMQPMQPMSPGMAAGQMLPFNPNMALGFRSLENLENRKHHSKFNEDNKSPFDAPDADLEKFNFANFLKENADELPFANMESSDSADLGNFEPSSDQGEEEGQFRFYDKEQ
uniref:Conotoxin B2 superfamily protein n=1 Tax=Conus miles TaxID=69564 RepID=A0AA50AGD1_CONMI|nr:conotoxin precursor B2 superfamily protein [Conus miles]